MKSNFKKISEEHEQFNGQFKGGLKKIKEPENTCLSSEHNPPMHIVLSPGTYEYTCPVCGKVTVFTVPLIIC